MHTHWFQKHPAETYPIGVDYLNAAPENAVLVSGVWSAVEESSQADATSLVFDDPSAAIDTTIAKGRVQNGLLGRTYVLGITVTFDTGDVLHDQVLMQVVASG